MKPKKAFIQLRHGARAALNVIEKLKHGNRRHLRRELSDNNL
jgi:hypothetical protein